MFISMRNSGSRTITQALVVFLFKLRRGSSNKMIQQILGLEYEQKVSDYYHQIMNAFEKDVLPTCFGLNAKSREDLISTENRLCSGKAFSTLEIHNWH